jgi:O-antigen/teichoic acid export membrane protein
MTSFTKSTAYYTAANVLPQAVGFLFLPIYSRYMSPADFGIVSGMETLYYIFSIIVCFSLDRAAQRFYFDSNVLDVRKKVLSTLFIASVFLAIFFVVIVFLVAPLLQLVFISIPFYPYFVYCILSVALNSLSLITTLYYQVSEQPRLYFLLRVSRFVSQILLIVFFVVYLENGAAGQLKAELLCVFMFVPVYFLIAHRHFDWQFDFEILKRAMAYSLPFLPTLLVAWVLSLSDRVFLEHFTGLEELGVYSMGYKISMAFFIFTSAFTMTYTPIFYNLANSDDQISANKKLYRYGWFAAIAFVVLMFGFSLFAKEIVFYVLDDRYEKSGALIRMFLVAHLFSSIMGVTSSLYLLQAKKTKLNMYVSLQAALLNLLLNYLLIPSYGVYGAAIATVLSMIELTIIQYWVSKNGYFIYFPWPRLLGLFASLNLIIAFYHFYFEAFTFAALTSKILFLMIFFATLFWKRKDIKLFFASL